MVFFILTGKMKISDASNTIKGILPNVLFTMPLGLLMAWLFNMEGGHWIAMVMLFPLLLARYAWSLYIESQVQHMRLIEAFVSTMEAKDHYTEGHSRRVGALSVQIAKQLRFSNAQRSNRLKSQPFCTTLVKSVLKKRFSKNRPV